MLSKLTDENIRSRSGVPGTTVVVNYTDSSAASAAALTPGRLYRLCPTTDCYVALGPVATAAATTNDMLIGAFQEVWITTPTTSEVKIAAIRNTADGKLTATPFVGLQCS